MKGCVLIPTFNESVIIYDLVLNVKKLGLDVLVIDDGSSDDTRSLAEKAGAELISHSRNMGKGASLRSGFQSVVNRDYEFVVTMDGDGQHHPDDLSTFLEFFKSGKADIIVGNRMEQTETMPYVRWLTNKLMSMLISSICKKYIPDTQCGFRLIRKNVLKDLAISTSNYEIESEMLIQAAKKKYRIESVNIKTIYEGQDSKINPFVDTMRFFRFLLKDWIRGGAAITKEFFNDIVIKHSSVIFISSLLCNIMNLAFWLFMIRRLDQIEYGILSSMVSALALLGLPVSILQTVLARYFSEFKAQDRKERVQTLFRAFLKRIIYLNVAIVVVILLLSKTIANFLHIADSYFIYFTAISMIATTSLVLTISTMQGLQLFLRIASNSLIQGFSKVFFGILLVFSGMKSLGGFLGIVLSSVCALSLSIFQLPKWVFQMKRKEYKAYKTEINLKEIYGYFFPVSIALIAYTFFITTDIILVKHFFSESDTGIYSIAQTVGKIVLFLPTAISLVFFPVTVQHDIQKKNTLPILRKCLFLVGGLSSGAFIFTFAFPGLMLRLIAGRVVPECISLVRFLIFPMSLFSIVHIFIYYNLSLRRMKFIRNIFILSICQIAAMWFLHRTLYDIAGIMLIIAAISLFLGIKSSFGVQK
jgi:O-antigen/teichoic acid export membrane protein